MIELMKSMYESMIHPIYNNLFNRCVR